MAIISLKSTPWVSFYGGAAFPYARRNAIVLLQIDREPIPYLPLPVPPGKSLTAPRFFPLVR